VLRILQAFAPAVMGIAVAGTSLAAQDAAGARTLSFYNIHTKETVTITYKKDGEYLDEGLKRINHIMRDWRRDLPTKMDPELIDTIWEIYQDVGATKPIHLISGYRSRKTNERLRRRRGGQARKSQHILGKAADIHFPGVSVKKLRNSALVREVGGVGYYPRSGIPFVHVDTGRVRNWPRLPRQELAALFPSGKTKYLPTDGRPLTRRDSMIALAKMDKKIDDFITAKSKIKLPPKMMMASLAPPTPNWFKAPKASPETTASIPREKPAPRARLQLAALTRGKVEEPEPMPLSSPPARGPGRVPVIEISSLDEAEHPEELTYRPFTVLPLLSDASVSSAGALARLSAPGPDKKNYLLRDHEGSFSVALARGLGYTQRLEVVKFGSRQPASSEANGALAGRRAPGKLIRTASR
ncbi:MAG: DUF882 domain-containing protein, partial [Alphaproteobacteria bacterium]